MALVDNLTAEFRFEEASGNATDSVSGIVLTAQGSLNYQQAGLIGYSISGTTSSPSASLIGFTSGDAAFDVDTSDWSISCWNYFPSASISNYIFSKFDAASAGRKFYVQLQTNYFRLGKPSDDLNYIPSLSTGAWHHLVVTYKESTKVGKVYINGVYVATKTFSSSISTTLDAFDANFFARKDSSTEYYMGNGRIDLIQFFKDYVVTDGGVSLTATAGGDVATLYNSGSGVELVSTGSPLTNPLFFGGGL